MGILCETDRQDIFSRIKSTSHPMIRTEKAMPSCGIIDKTVMYNCYKSQRVTVLKTV
jgi:hypothetical protein